MDHLRIFISSPGDVADERALALSLINDELPYDPFLRDRVTFEMVSWDNPAAPTPMIASATPQEAVNRFGPEPSKCDVVVVVLWSRLGTHLDLKKDDGSHYRSGTEWEFENALNAPQRPVILVYRRMEEPKIGAYDPKRMERLHQVDLVGKFFEHFQNPDGSLRGGWTAYATPTEFRDRLAKDLRHLLSERLRSGPLVSADTMPAGSAAPVWSGSPYPGLRPFRAEEAPIFFGRGREVDGLISRLRDPAQRFLAVVGASGSGKSSLIYAGLLPRLAAGGIEGSQHWLVLAFTPGACGDNPLLALASELKARLPTSAQRPQIEIAKALAKSARLPEEYLEALLANRPSGAVLVLLIDQFEELLTHASKSYQQIFIEFLAQLTSDPRVRMLATMRTDFLPQCAAEPTLAALLQAGTFVLGSPGLVALAEIIRKPAERAGLEIDPALIDKFLTDAGGDPGEALPLVAFCLEELYEQTAPEHRLTLDSYRAIGGLRGAISRRIGELLSEFPESQAELLETALAQLFRALVRVDAAGKAARQWASRDDLAAASPPVPQLVEKLIKGRLLQAGEATGRAAITLAHEALIEGWPSLNQWLTASRAQMQRVQSLLLNLESPESSDRIYAAIALGHIGQGVVEVLPSLRTALCDPDGNVRTCAARALGQIGPGALEVVPNLIPLLSEGNGDVRRAAVEALGQIGPAADEAVPALISALGDAAVRTSAAQALGRIGREVAKVVPSLITALGDGANVVSHGAIQALGQIGPAAVDAVPALIPILSKATRELRRATVEALGQIGPGCADTVPALISALKDADKDVRKTAIEALGKIGPDAAETVPALISALKDADKDVRKTAIEALGKIGPDSADTVPALISALKDADKDVRKTAIEALGKIGPDSADTVPALISALKDADKDVRKTAIEALGKIGPGAWALGVLPELIDALGDRDLGIRQTAAEALGRIGREVAEVIPPLLIALGQADSLVRRSVVKALGHIGPGAAEVLPSLRTALIDADSAVRRAAVEAVGQIGPAASELVPELLIPLADHTNWLIRRAACDALGKIGPKAAMATSALIPALKDRDKDVRRSAAEALGQIGSLAVEALPQLISALQDADENVRTTAARALDEIRQEKRPKQSDTVLPVILREAAAMVVSKLFKETAPFGRFQWF